MCLCEILGEYVITDTKTHVHLTLIPSWLSLRSFLDWFTVILSEGQEELTVRKPPTRTAYKSEALLANNKTNTYAEKNRSQRTLIHSQSSRERKKQTLTKKRAATKLAASTGCALRSLQLGDGRYFASSHRCFQLIPNSQSLRCLSSRLQPAASKYIYSVSIVAEPPLVQAGKCVF